jgi:preprotein translocase subunit SecF
MSALSRAYNNENDVDFPKWSKRMLVVSTIVVLVSIISLATQWLSLSMDFEGGSRWEVPSADFHSDDAAEVLADNDIGSARYQEVTLADGTRVLRVSSDAQDIEQGARIAQELATAAGVETGEVTVTTIGPSWGDDITRQAAMSLVWFLVLIGAYLAWRLEPKMALGALAAVLHDIIITVGIYSIFQIEVTPATVIAFLTILGYSLYDTVVVFDRLHDGLQRFSRTGQYTFASIMRRSLNQSLMRCINTSITTILPIFSMLVFGGWVFGQPLLSDFSLALVIGLALGIYSSLFVAAPVTMLLKEREPRYREIRSRLAARGVDVTDTRWRDPRAYTTAVTGVSGSTSATKGEAPASAAARPTGPNGAPALGVTVGGHPPRPRKSRPKR